MKATLGRAVIVHGIDSNGALQHPATITRAWSEADTEEKPVCVNLTVFPDCAAPRTQGSVMLYNTKEAALFAFDNNVSTGAPVAYWPERN